MMEVKFTGTPAEVKAEIKEFIGLESTTVTEYKVGDMSKKIEETKPVETQLPVQETVEVIPETTVVHEATVLPTLPTSTIEYTVEDLQRIGGSLIQKNRDNMELISNLLSNYGVNAVKDLPKEHYGAFVQELKGLGADV